MMYVVVSGIWSELNEVTNIVIGQFELVARFYICSTKCRVLNFVYFCSNLEPMESVKLQLLSEWKLERCASSLDENDNCAQELGHFVPNEECREIESWISLLECWCRMQANPGEPA